MKHTPELSASEIESMRAITKGADVFSYKIASDLRGVEKKAPALIHICSPMGKYDPVGQLPYFGAILTKAGRAAIAKAEGRP